ncbi:hypothetical protein EI94DRAFT_1871670 [Lactarius quietus]|nr:hypothetical protein EI94DRAFT_1871670 [Lactarius quietus]
MCSYNPQLPRRLIFGRELGTEEVSDSATATSFLGCELSGVINSARLPRDGGDTAGWLALAWGLGLYSCGEGETEAVSNVHGGSWWSIDMCQAKGTCVPSPVWKTEFGAIPNAEHEPGMENVLGKFDKTSDLLRFSSLKWSGEGEIMAIHKGGTVQVVTIGDSVWHYTAHKRHQSVFWRNSQQSEVNRFGVRKFFAGATSSVPVMKSKYSDTLAYR